MSHPSKSILSNPYILILLTAGAIPVMFLMNIAFGSVDIPFPEVIRALVGLDVEESAWSKIVLKSRLPQAFTASLAGSGLAVGGLMMQTLFRNPLAGPSILGISSGASLGVAFIMMFIGGIQIQAI